MKKLLTLMVCFLVGIGVMKAVPTTLYLQTYGQVEQNVVMLSNNPAANKFAYVMDYDAGGSSNGDLYFRLQEKSGSNVTTTYGDTGNGGTWIGQGESNKKELASYSGNQDKNYKFHGGSYKGKITIVADFSGSKNYVTVYEGDVTSKAPEYPATMTLAVFDNPTTSDGNKKESTYTSTSSNGKYTFTVSGFNTSSDYNMWFRFQEKEGNTVKNAWSVSSNTAVANNGTYTVTKTSGGDAGSNFYLPAKTAVSGDITITLDLTKSSNQMSISFGGTEFTPTLELVGGSNSTTWSKVTLDGATWWKWTGDMSTINSNCYAVKFNNQSYGGNGQFTDPANGTYNVQTGTWKVSKAQTGVSVYVNFNSSNALNQIKFEGFDYTTQSAYCPSSLTMMGTKNGGWNDSAVSNLTPTNNKFTFTYAASNKEGNSISFRFKASNSEYWGAESGDDTDLPFSGNTATATLYKHTSVGSGSWSNYKINVGDYTGDLHFTLDFSTSTPTITVTKDGNQQSGEETYKYYFWSGSSSAGGWPSSLSDDFRFKKNTEGDYELKISFTSENRYFGIKRTALNATSSSSSDSWYSTEDMVIDKGGYFAITGNSGNMVLKNANEGEYTFTLELNSDGAVTGINVKVPYATSELYIGGNEFGGIDEDAINTALTKNDDGKYEPIKISWSGGTQHEFNFYDGATKQSTRMGVSGNRLAVNYGTYTTNASGSSSNAYDLANLNTKTVWLQVTNYDAANHKVTYTLSKTKPGTTTYKYAYRGNLAGDSWSNTQFTADKNYTLSFNVESVNGSKGFGIARFDSSATDASVEADNGTGRKWYSAGSDQIDIVKDNYYELVADAAKNFYIDCDDLKSVTLQLVLDDENLPTGIQVSLTRKDDVVIETNDTKLFITGMQNHHNLQEGAAEMTYKGNGLYEYEIGKYNGARFQFCIYDNKNHVYHKTEDQLDEVKVSSPSNVQKCEGFTSHAIPADGNFRQHQDWIVYNGNRVTLKNAKIQVNINQKWVAFIGDEDGKMADYYFVGDMNSWYSDEFTMDINGHNEFKGLSGYRMLNELDKWAFTKESDGVYSITLPKNTSLTGQFQIFGGQTWDDGAKRYMHEKNAEDATNYSKNYYGNAIKASDDDNENWHKVANGSGVDYKQHNLLLAHNAILPFSEERPVKITLNTTDSKVKVEGIDQDYYLFIITQNDNDNSGLKAIINSDKPNKNNYWLPGVTVDFPTVKAGEASNAEEYKFFQNGHIAHTDGVLMNKITPSSTGQDLNTIFKNDDYSKYLKAVEGGGWQLNVESANITNYAIQPDAALWVTKIPNSFEGPAGTKFRAGLMNSLDENFTDGSGNVVTWWTVVDNHIVVIPGDTHVHIKKDDIVNNLLHGKVDANDIKIYYRIYGPGDDYKETLIFGHDGTQHLNTTTKAVRGDMRNAFNQSEDVRNFGWIELNEALDFVDAEELGAKEGTWQSAVYDQAGDNDAKKGKRVNIRTHHQNAYVQFRIDVPGNVNLEDAIINPRTAARYKEVRRAADSETQTIYSPLWSSMGDLAFNVANEHQLQGASLFQTLDTNDIVTGIEEILDYIYGEDLDSDMPVYYYNLQGIQVSNPSNGIFIRVKGNRSVKVAL